MCRSSTGSSGALAGHSYVKNDPCIRKAAKAHPAAGWAESKTRKIESSAHPRQQGVRLGPLHPPGDRRTPDVLSDEERRQAVVALIVVGTGPASRWPQARRQRSLRHGAGTLSWASATVVCKAPGVGERRLKASVGKYAVLSGRTGASFLISDQSEAVVETTGLLPLQSFLSNTMTA